MSKDEIDESGTYRLTVVRFHASLDLRVDPQCRSLSHRAQEKGLEVEENFVLLFPIAGWLVRNYRGEVAVSAAVLDENYASECVGLIGIRAHRHFQQFYVAPGALGTYSSAQLKLRADRYRLIDRLRAHRWIRGVSGRLAIERHFVLETTRGFFHDPRYPRSVRTEIIFLLIFLFFNLFFMNFTVFPVQLILNHWHADVHITLHYFLIM